MSVWRMEISVDRTLVLGVISLGWKLYPSNLRRILNNNAYSIHVESFSSTPKLSN